MKFLLLLQITWIDGLGNVLHSGIETSTEKYEDGPLFTVKSVLKVMPRKEHHNTTFTCQSQNAADRTPHNAKLRVEVRKLIIKLYWTNKGPHAHPYIITFISNTTFCCTFSNFRVIYDLFLDSIWRIINVHNGRGPKPKARNFDENMLCPTPRKFTWIPTNKNTTVKNHV